MASEKESMSIWLIKEGEDLPIFSTPRLLRTGMLADYLSAQGHKVIWWTSSFCHSTKTYYCSQYEEHNMNDNETIILLHSKASYKKNISLARIKYHRLLAKQFKKHAAQKGRPDIILCAWPTPQFAAAAVEYGEKNDVPVILDVRDFWPDLFVKAFPERLQKAAEWALFPLKRAATRTFRRASGIVGVTVAAVEWGCSYAGRKSGRNDRSIFIGHKKTVLPEEAFQKNLEWWQNLNISQDTWNICLFSTLSKGLDLDTVIKAVVKVACEYPSIRLVVGGKGDVEEYFKAVAAASPNVIFAGWLGSEQMDSLMRISKCGVYCLRNTDDFKDTFSNKAVQYLSGGLPILNSLTGFARQFIGENLIGLTYVEKDVESCAQNIKTLYNNEDMRQEMSQNAFKVFKENFDAAVVNKQFEDYLYAVKENRKT